MLDVNDLKLIISLLEKNRINYYVFGGIALDGLRGVMTRTHSDLDIYVGNDDLEKFCSIMNSHGYPCIKRENMYFIDHDTLKVGIVILTKEKNTCIAYGNKTIEIYPNKIFTKKQYGKIDGITFCIVPNEVLAFESQYSKYSEDREFGINLSYHKVLFSQIEHTVLRSSRKNP